MPWGEAQRALDAWRVEYNTVRPHEALGMRCPADVYVPSARAYPPRLPSLPHEVGEVLRRVQSGGVVSYAGREFRVGKAFKGELVALRPTASDGVLSVHYCLQEIKRITL